MRAVSSCNVLLFLQAKPFLSKDQMDETRYWMWARRKLSSSGGGVHLPPPPPPPRHQSSNYDSWEEQAFAEDAAGVLGGCVWPPRSYSCTFCRREFRSAQALGGHMNVHRRDRARLKQSSSPTSPNPEINSNSNNNNNNNYNSSSNCNHHQHLLPSHPYYSPPHPHNIYPLLQNPTPNPNPNPNSNPNHKINDVVAASTSLSPSKMTAAVASHQEESSREKGLQLLLLSSSSYASSSNNIVQENNSNHFLFSTQSYLRTQNPTMSRLKLGGEDLKIISREACGKRQRDRSITEEEEGGGGGEEEEEEEDEEGERINKRRRTTDHGSTGLVCYLLDPKLGSHLSLPLPSEGIECSRGPAVPEELDLELRLGNHHHQQQQPNDHHPVFKKNCSKLLA